MGLVQTQNLRT